VSAPKAPSRLGALKQPRLGGKEPTSLSNQAARHDASNSFEHL